MLVKDPWEKDKTGRDVNVSVFKSEQYTYTFDDSSRMEKNGKGHIEDKFEEDQYYDRTLAYEEADDE